MKVLVACEFSGTVRTAFAALGHDAWSCDIIDTEIPGNHIIGDAREIVRSRWDLVIAHPPCTYLTNAGVRHLHSVPSRNGKLPAIHGQTRWDALNEAASFFRDMLASNSSRVAVENPIPHRYAVERIGWKYDQIIQPWQFGHGEKKATCLWLRGLPLLQPTDIVEGRVARIHSMSPGPNRSKERSRTYPGIAAAMAQQWGAL